MIKTFDNCIILRQIYGLLKTGKKNRNVFFSITPDIKEFCIGEFLPELRLATVNFNLPQDEFLRLEGNTYSTLIKLLYAFLWQVIHTNTGKSLSGALIFASTNPQYDDRLIIELQIHENSKLKPWKNMLCTEIVSDICTKTFK